MGDTSSPIGASGAAITYAADEPGRHYAWVQAASACSTLIRDARRSRSVPTRTMHRVLLLLLAAAVAPAALGGYYVPVLERGAVRVAVGESVKVQVTAVWVYLPFLPTMFTPWVFGSASPMHASVQGRLNSPEGSGTMLITGRKPGKTIARVLSYDDVNVVEVTVYCREEAPVQAAEARQTTRPGEAVTLRALTSSPLSAKYVWYRGKVGDLTSLISGGGPELPFAPDGFGTHHVWVLVTTTCSSSMAQFEIEAVAPRRRTARH